MLTGAIRKTESTEWKGVVDEILEINIVALSR